jgi:predicted acyltransferase
MTGRIVSLDAFRGLAIAAMILVNNPGSWSHVYGLEPATSCL